MTLRTERQRENLAQIARELPKKLARYSLIEGEKVDVAGFMLLEAGYTREELRTFQALDTLWDELAKPKARAVVAYGFAKPKKTLVEVFLSASDTLSRAELASELLRVSRIDGAKPVRVKG